ncbi:MAG: hypothetical protein ABW215_20945 [Kibdelosporangium sp.]
MWIDPLAKWRPELTGTPEFESGRAELLAGRPEQARRHFEAGVLAHDLVGLGDALLLLGEHERAAGCFQRAAERVMDPFVECGLSQAFVLRGDAGTAVARLEALPPDPVVRHHLAGALLEVADQVRSVTRDEQLVITSRRQFDTCAHVARRVAEVAVDDVHLAAGQQLRTVTEEGQGWVWSQESAALGYSLFAALAGLAVVVVGGTTDSVLLVVLGALVGAAAIYGVVLAYRRQVWQVRAARVAPMVWRHGPG